MPYPFLLKRCREDNYMGLAKVECEAELARAMAEAFKFDSSDFCERFIPLGRDIRMGVVEDESGQPTISCCRASSTSSRRITRCASRWTGSR